MNWWRRLWRWLTDRHHTQEPLSDRPHQDRGGMGWDDE